MLKRLYVRFEIIGYSRAIGALVGKPGITKDHIQNLYDGRNSAIKRLTQLKIAAKEQRFEKSLVNA